MLRRSLATITACCLCLAALAVGGVVALKALRPSSPFKEQTVDRTNPALLKSLTDLAQLHAASGQYQVLVDLEHDTAYVPSIVKGDRSVYAALGSVDAMVDLGGLTESSVTRAPDGSVTIDVPAVTLAPAHLDLAKSKVVAKQRGLLDRIGSAIGDDKGNDREVQVLAESKVAAAAASDAELRDRAEANVRSTIGRLLSALGVTGTVRFVASPA